MSDFRSLPAYQKGFKMAMEVFLVSKSFPDDEANNLTRQFRTSARTVCAHIAQAYAKRAMRTSYVGSISDAEMENSSLKVWVDFAYACQYINKAIHTSLTNKSEEVSQLLQQMSRQWMD
ncbi:MAG: four helix bundle protein [Bacteroidota bacterium]